MPFKSEKQRRYLWRKHPKMAQKWTDEHGSKPVKKQSGGTMTTEETFKKMVPFSPWASPKFKWKRWLLGPYRSAQNIDKVIKSIKAGECPPGSEQAGKKWGMNMCKKKPVKKKHGGVHNTWYNQFYRTAQKIDKAIENWPEERKRLKKNFKTNVKNLINKIKKEGGHTPDDAIPKKKSGGSMDPYYGSYIKGRVDGKTLSNPSYRKYYKGLI